MLDLRMSGWLLKSSFVTIVWCSVGKQFNFMLSSAVSHKSSVPVLRQEKDAKGNGSCDGPAMHLGQYFNNLR